MTAGVVSQVKKNPRKRTGVWVLIGMLFSRSSSCNKHKEVENGSLSR